MDILITMFKEPAVNVAILLNFVLIVLYKKLGLHVNTVSLDTI